MRTRVSLLVMTTVCSTGASAFAQCQYEVLVYPSAECVFWSDRPYSGLGLNNLGGWSGYRWDCPGNTYLPIYCPAGGTPQELPLPPGAGPDGAQASDVNDVGVVVGQFRTPPYDLDVACIWWPNGEITIIPPPPGGDRSYAYSVNNNGEVVGQRFLPTPGKPYHWQNGILTEIDTDPFPSGIARAISDAGYVAGSLGNLNVNGRAFRWKDGRTTILEPAGGHAISDGRGVNNQGDVAGISKTYLGGAAGYIYSATLWTLTETRILPLPQGYSSATAIGVNDQGVVIGSAVPPAGGGPTIQVVWINGEVYPLNALTVPGSPSIAGTVAISNAGQILSSGSAKLLTTIGASASDLNGDCAVNGADLALILSEWGPVLQPGSACDINGDGTVDGADLGLLLSAWSP